MVGAPEEGGAAVDVRKLILEAKTSCDHSSDFPCYVRVSDPSSDHATSWVGHRSSQKSQSYYSGNSSASFTPQNSRKCCSTQFRGYLAVLGLAPIPAMKLENKNLIESRE